MRARKGFWWRSFVAVENNCGAHGAPSQYRAAPRRSQRFGELSASLRLLKMSKLQLKIQWFLRSRIIEAGRWGRPNYAWWCACEPTTTHTIHGFVCYSARALADIAFVCSRPFPRSQLPTLLPNHNFEVESDGFYLIE